MYFFYAAASGGGDDESSKHFFSAMLATLIPIYEPPKEAFNCFRMTCNYSNDFILKGRFDAIKHTVLILCVGYTYRLFFRYCI